MREKKSQKATSLHEVTRNTAKKEGKIAKSKPRKLTVKGTGKHTEELLRWHYLLKLKKEE